MNECESKSKKGKRKNEYAKQITPAEWMNDEEGTGNNEDGKSFVVDNEKKGKHHKDRIERKKDITIHQRRHGRRQFKDIEMFLTNRLTVMCLL
jgi:hypothetical protein